MKYYVRAASGDINGPLDVETLAELVAWKKVSADDLACAEGSKEWRRLGDLLPSLFRAAPKAQERAAAVPWTAWAALVLLAFIGWQLLGLRLSVERGPRFEYRIESPSDGSFDSDMNRFGRDGWEVVSARRATDALKIASYEVILKRRARD
jgi:hypothetical protein